jgi:hypothetical protein
VIDGTDSTWGNVCNAASCVNQNGQLATGFGIGYVRCDAWEVDHTVLKHLSNGIQCPNIETVHDSLFEFMWNPSFGGRHGNTLETDGGTSGSTFRFYNNVLVNLDSPVNLWPQASTMYIFNNVFADTYDAGWSPPNPNCLMLSPPGMSGSGVLAAWIYNNTFSPTCNVQAFPGNATTATWAAGSTTNWANNQIIGFSSLSGLFTCGTNCSGSVTDHGGEVYQTAANAASQGYTNANLYAPTAGTNVTVAVGLDESSECSTFSSDSALCSGTTAGVLEEAGEGGYIAVSPGSTANARGSTWNAGAYQYGAGSISTPTPDAPTNLTVN